MSEQYIDAEFLKDHILHKEDEITVATLGGKKLKIKKLNALQSKFAGNIVLNEFGREKFQKYYEGIQIITSEGTGALNAEEKLRDLLGDDFEKFSDASMKSMIYKVATSTGIDIDIIKFLEDEIILEISQKIDATFNKQVDDLKKKL